MPGAEGIRADVPFGRLTPARVIHFGIHVGKETIFVRRRTGPRRARRPFGEFYRDDGFDALEAVLPGDDEPQRRAVLIGQHLAVQAHREEGQGMHGLIHPQSFHIGPLEHARALAGHLFRIVQGLEFDELRLRGGLEALEQIAQRKPYPRDHHRPRFHAAQAIHPFL